METRQSNQRILADMLRIGFIKPGLDARDRDSLVHEIAILAEGTGLVLDRQALENSLLARECEGSTAVNGCAFLHPRIAKPELVSSSFAVLGRSPHPIPFGDPLGVGVDIFFAICCRDATQCHQVLTRIMLMIVRTPLLAQLRQSGDAQEMLEAALRCERDLLKC